MPATVYHVHTQNVCPVVGATHDWCPKQPSDSRSPCPALNTLANHGFLPRDGKQLTPDILIHALKEGYGLSSPLAYFLVYGGQFLLGQTGAFSLSDLARHNRIEHNASLAHGDAHGRDEYAPIAPDPKMVKDLLNSARDGHVMTIEDIARERVAREHAETLRQCPALDSMHAEIARGEMAIAVGLFRQIDSDGEEGIPVDLLRTWFLEERLPEDWKPSHVQGLLETINASTKIRDLMTQFKSELDAGHEEVTR
ncbi:Cloroperoxidase [Gloeopeniophorella convolvens]|nr:Cloroperoxidase [Gloeopeniophorella convolvens]